MCRFISFHHNPINGDIKVAVLNSHSETEKKLNLNLSIWREGHYLPNGTVECRTLDKDRVSSKECCKRLKRKYPTFIKFFNWAVFQPESVGGSLDLSG